MCGCVASQLCWVSVPRVSVSFVWLKPSRRRERVRKRKNERHPSEKKKKQQKIQQGSSLKERKGG